MTILVTCIIGPVLVEKYGYRLAGQSELELNEKTSVQQRVLVPIANPATTVRLVEFASNIKVDSDDPIFPISVISSYRSSEPLQERAEKVLEQATEHNQAAGSQATPRIKHNTNVQSGK